MRYTYTFTFSHRLFVSFSGGRSFSLYSSGSLYQNTHHANDSYVTEKVTGNFGMIFGCNVVEVDRTATGVVIRSNMRIKYFRIDNFAMNTDPPTDAEQQEAADAHLKQCEAWEDGQAVVDKEDWSMVTA